MGCPKSLGLERLHSEGVAHGRSFRHGNLYYDVSAGPGGEPLVRMAGPLRRASRTPRTALRPAGMKIGGGCHCGAVRFEAEVPEPPVPALECNCSICRRTGFVHVIVPHESFKLVSGRGSLASYRFGTGTAEHLFCRTCGVKSFYQPRSHPQAWSVNANCLDEPVELAIEQFDGRDWDRAKAELDAGEGGS